MAEYDGAGGLNVDKYLALTAVADEYTVDELDDLADYLSDEDFDPRVATPPPVSALAVPCCCKPRGAVFACSPARRRCHTRKPVAQRFQAPFATHAAVPGAANEF